MDSLKITKSKKIIKPEEKQKLNSIKVPHKDINKGGRPAFYQTPEELQEKINEYFEIECADEIIVDSDNKHVVDSKGRPVIHYNPPTLSGLALFLGFADRQSLYDYRDRKIEKQVDESEEKHQENIVLQGRFSCTVRRGISRLENYAESQLFIGSSTGAIFWLKNRGWRDKTEVENSGVMQIVVASEEKKKLMESI